MFHYVSQQFVQVCYPSLMLLFVGKFNELGDCATFFILLLSGEIKKKLLHSHPI